MRDPVTTTSSTGAGVAVASAGAAGPGPASACAAGTATTAAALANSAQRIARRNTSLLTIRYVLPKWVRETCKFLELVEPDQRRALKVKPSRLSSVAVGRG